MKKCPNCGLINTDSSQICDCGYDFQKNATAIYIKNNESKAFGDYCLFFIAISLHICKSCVALSSTLNISGIIYAIGHATPGLILSLAIFTPIIALLKKSDKLYNLKNMTIALYVGLIVGILSSIIIRFYRT